MKYIVFTSKHHDGFAMYHSKCSAYNVVDATPFRRDVLKEMQLACQKHDIRLGLYYSQAQDWHDPDGYMFTKDNSKKNFQNYLDRKCIPQIKEILTGYGDIALIWFDTPMATSVEQSRELIRTVKNIQPDCIVSGRIGNNLGEYMTTGDNFIPALPYQGDWEVPATLNDTWGFNKDDHNWKSPDEIIRLLIKINSRGETTSSISVLTLPGLFPRNQWKFSIGWGGYVRENHEAIFGTKVLPQYAYELDGILFTGKARHLYVHILKPQKELYLPNIGNKAAGASLLKNGEALAFRNTGNCEGNSVIEITLPPSLRQKTNYCIDINTEEDEPVFEPLE
jgi:alpha-L-fucosidase